MALLKVIQWFATNCMNNKSFQVTKIFPNLKCDRKSDCQSFENCHEANNIRVSQNNTIIEDPTVKMKQIQFLKLIT